MSYLVAGYFAIDISCGVAPGASGCLWVPPECPTGVPARGAHGSQTRLWAVSDRTGYL